MPTDCETDRRGRGEEARAVRGGAAGHLDVGQAPEGVARCTFGRALQPEGHSERSAYGSRDQTARQCRGDAAEDCPPQRSRRRGGADH
jgi:hypothetical protein